MSDAVLNNLITTAGVIILALLSLRNGRKSDSIHTGVEAVKREVTTMNAQTLAQLSDANETRRIDKIPVGERTMGEKHHLVAVGEAKD